MIFVLYIMVVMTVLFVGEQGRQREVTMFARFVSKQGEQGEVTMFVKFVDEHMDKVTLLHDHMVA